MFVTIKDFSGRDNPLVKNTARDGQIEVFRVRLVGEGGIKASITINTEDIDDLEELLPDLDPRRAYEVEFRPITFGSGE